MKGASQTEQNGFSRRQTLSHKEERSRLKPGYSQQKISLENSWQAPLIRDTCGCAVGGPLVLMLLWSLTCAVYRHVFLQKGPGIPKLMEKILPTYWWEWIKISLRNFNLVISSGSEWSCQSIFIIYNGLSDSNPRDKMEWQWEKK